MSGWCFADVWETVAATRPDDPALVHGDTVRSWRDLDRRADAVAAALCDAGLQPDDKVAQYLGNQPAYLESVYAAFKVAMVPVNTNYRYTDDELVYLWDNSDSRAVVFGARYAPTIERIRDRLRGVALWLWVDDYSGVERPDWAVDYEASATSGAEPPGAAKSARSGDDIFMLYTGGTTGMPKGVMWRQDDLFRILNSSAIVRHEAEPGDLDRVAQLFADMEGPGPSLVPACPLMHGTGLYTSFGIWSSAGSIVTLAGDGFDPVELLDVIDRRSVQATAIVGDAFAKPIVAALDAAPDRWDLTSWWLVISSGVMFSADTKQRLLAHHDRLVISDLYSSSEALGMGSSVTSRKHKTSTAEFRLGERAIVVDDDLRPVEPGSGVAGRVAIGGLVPLGYYKDEAKTRATFPTIDGVRYSVPGDFATVDADGTIHLLGRGSVCINTGGEKVFPEEVEEVLKADDGVADAVVVGVPDERWGEKVVAVVEPAGASAGDDDAEAARLIGVVKGSLAGYKAPKDVVWVPTIGRAPNGKVDYKRLRGTAAERLGIEI